MKFKRRFRRCLHKFEKRQEKEIEVCVSIGESDDCRIVCTMGIMFKKLVWENIRMIYFIENTELMFLSSFNYDRCGCHRPPGLKSGGLSLASAPQL